MIALENQKDKVTVSNRYLLFTFLKVGSVSFGGNMALLSVVQRIMVERDKCFANKLYFDAISIATLLPGPMAVNAVTFIGYSLNKKRGAAISLIAILLPACLLMLLLSWAYFSFAHHYGSSEVIYYVTGAVSAIVFSTAITMYQKEIGKNISKTIVCLVAFSTILLTSSYLITLGLIAIGIWLGMSGRIEVGHAGTTAPVQQSKFKFALQHRYIAIIVLLVVIECLFLFNVQAFVENIYAKIAMVFSGISLSLFGGGFVAVPVMQTLFVNDLQWLTAQEFVDAIAFSQVTPGPILVSATFIGYKLAGVGGAIVATVTMFTPSAMLIILVSKLHKLNQDNLLLRQALDGVKVVIIGMIAASAFKIITHAGYNIKAFALFVIVFAAVQFFKVSPFVAILFSALAGFLVEKVI